MEVDLYVFVNIHVVRTVLHPVSAVNCFPFSSKSNFVAISIPIQIFILTAENFLTLVNIL
jgi:hypothetical protein